MFVDRFMSTAMRYPCNYGYIPADVLILLTSRSIAT